MKKIFSTILAVALAAVTFTSCEDVPAPYEIPGESGGGSSSGGTTVVTPTGSGTLADPFNVAAAVSYINSLSADVNSDKEYYIKGKVLANTTTEATISSYGNMTFTMVDEGNESVVFTAFQVYGPNKQKFTSVDQIKTGQTVVVYGKVVNYKGNTPETVGKGSAYVVSVEGEGSSSGGGDTPTPSDAIDVTCAKAAELALALDDKASSTEVYSVTGYITSVVGSVSNNQQTFWMADTKDGGQVFEAYWANLPAGVTAFTAGAKVKITGNLMRYGTTPEIKNATVVILEAAGEGGDSGDTPTSDVTSSVDGSTVTFINTKAEAGTETISFDFNSLGYTETTEVTTINLADGTSLLFDKADNTNQPKFFVATKGIRIYGGNSVTITGKAAIAKIVVTCDGTYVGAGDALKATLDGNIIKLQNGVTGNTQFRMQTITITYAK